MSRKPPWRDGRVVEGAALEMLFRGNSNEGSNPSLSVLKLQHSKAFNEAVELNVKQFSCFLVEPFHGGGG